MGKQSALALSGLILFSGACGGGDSDTPTKNPIADARMGGTFDVETEVEVPASALAPDPAYSYIQRVSDFRSAPGETTISLMKEAGGTGAELLFAAIPGALEDKVAGAIDSAVTSAPGYEKLDATLGLADTVVTSFTVDSELVIHADGLSESSADHRIRALRFGPDRSIVLPVVDDLAGLPLFEQSASIATGRDSGGEFLFVGDHSFGFPYGDYAYAALDLVSQARFGSDFRTVVHDAFPCDQIAAKIADTCVFGLCIGHESDWNSLCETGVDYLLDEIQDQIAAQRFDALVLENGAATISAGGNALTGGTWDAQIDFGLGLREVNATFSGVRQ